MTTPVVRDVAQQLFIGGVWQDAESGRTLLVDNPATGEELCRVADASPADGRQAVEAAVTAQAGWAATPPRPRRRTRRHRRVPGVQVHHRPVTDGRG